MTTTQNALLCWIGVEHDRHVGDLLAGHAARGVQRLGPRAEWPGQPHDAGAQSLRRKRRWAVARTYLVAALSAVASVLYWVFVISDGD